MVSQGLLDKKNHEEYQHKQNPEHQYKPDEYQHKQNPRTST